MKYMVAKVVSSSDAASPPYYVAICHTTGDCVAQADDLTLLHCYMEKLQWTFEEL